MSSIAKRAGLHRAYPLAASVSLQGEEPAILNAAGLLVNVGAVGICAGITRLAVDNSQGVDKAAKATVEIGEHLFRNAGDITEANVGETAFFSAVDTVSIDSATNTRSTAGTIIEVASNGVWVELGV
ncbi:hypothetical protein MHM95_06105 [Pseudoalteromonas sp. CnMc7-15]|uniref:hypothetical protein n=1 Tax=Pseudoalteromonas TaxID=53246 RepID=UPI00034552CE|nr:MULTISPECIES: hypothetical protein [Pseudoalteromonas]MCG7565860.1 hypothetical protein [Pseudoalteromonas sp. CnMc7-15]|tara:strand:+ start:37234 stop:37614 length:381 start_codon:yes stop_codon:yes gene_type:complete